MRLFKGQFSGSLIPLMGGSLGIGSITICYYLAVVLQQQPALPYTWISQTARHYPGYIVFRVGTMSSGVLIVLTHLIHYFWINLICMDTLRINRYMLQLCMVVGIMGGLFLLGSTANLGTGQVDQPLHQFCANCFFGCSVIAMVGDTLLAVLLCTKGVPGVAPTVTAFKVALAVGTLMQIFVAVFHHKGTLGDDPLTNVLEYTIAFSLLGFLYLIAWDLRGMCLVYTNNNGQ